MSRARACFTSMEPRGRNLNNALACPATVSERSIRLGQQCASMTDAVFTGVTPNIEAEPMVTDRAGNDRPSVDTDPQLQRLATAISLSAIFYASDNGLHFQRREAGVDWMPAIALGHAANRHVGIPNRLELLKPMAGHRLIERREILIEKINQRPAGSVRSANRVNPWKSTNRIVAERVYLGCTLPVFLSSSAIGAGRTFSRSS